METDNRSEVMVQIFNSERTRELGPKGPSSRERALTATGVSKERPQSNVYSVRLNISSSVFMGADILFPDWYC